MNGPQLVCAGCNEPTTLFKPICDNCLQMAGQPECEHTFERMESSQGRICTKCGYAVLAR